MPGTATWYCARCSRFNDQVRAACDGCGRTRGSLRTQEAARTEPKLYWIRVAPSNAAPPRSKP